MSVLQIEHAPGCQTQILGDDTSINVTFDKAQSNVQIDSSGNLSAENDDVLYIATTGELIAAPTETGLTQAALEVLKPHMFPSLVQARELNWAWLQTTLSC